MNIQKNKFILVKPNDFFKQSIKIINYCLSDLEKDQFNNSIFTLNTIFKNNSIPINCQKVIIFIPLLCSSFKAKEFFTGFNFEEEFSKIKTINGKLLISFGNYSVLTNNSQCSLIKCDSSLSFATHKDLSKFVCNIEENNCMDKYIESLNEYFEIKKDNNYNIDKKIKILK